MSHDIDQTDEVPGLPDWLRDQSSRRSFLTGAASAIALGISLPEFLAACATGAPAAPKAGVGGILHVAGYEEMQDIDPHKVRTENGENWTSAIAEGILLVDASGKIVPKQSA